MPREDPRSDRGVEFIVERITYRRTTGERGKPSARYTIFKEVHGPDGVAETPLERGLTLGEAKERVKTLRQTK